MGICKELLVNKMMNSGGSGGSSGGGGGMQVVNLDPETMRASKTPQEIVELIENGANVCFMSIEDDTHVLFNLSAASTRVALFTSIVVEEDTPFLLGFLVNADASINTMTLPLV